MPTYARRSQAASRGAPARVSSATPAQADHGTGADAILELQRQLGNQAIQRLIGGAAAPVASESARLPAESAPAAAPASGLPETRTWTTVERIPFRATIRRGPSSHGGAQPHASPARSDAGIGAEHGGEQHQALFQQIGAAPAAAAGPAPAGATPEAEGAETAPAPAAEATFAIPDIEIPSLATIEKTDAVSGAFTYTGSITRGGAQPTGFGVTRSFGSKLTGVKAAVKPGTFEISGTFEHPITYQVRSGTGPGGQEDIPSEGDAKITKANYATVVSDLMPNMSDLNGRPPRTKFWAEDLTLRHELVHANDDKANGPAAMGTAVTWLNGQTAASIDEVKALLRAIPGRFSSALLAALSTEDGEKHAYGDGAPSYKARAEAVKAKGDKGDYK